MAKPPATERTTSTVPNDPTVGGSSERLNELAMGFKKSQALSAALEVDLFSSLSAGAGTPDEVAAHCKIDREVADRLMIICKAMGLIADVDGRTVNVDDVERFFVRDKSTFFGDFLRFTIGAEYDEWQGFADNIKDASSEPPPSKLYEGDLNDPERARAFTTAGYNSSIALAHRLAKRFDFSRFSRWLDFAGGSGCYAIAACERHDSVKVIVKDHPNVIPVTREFVGNHNLTDRIEAEPGDFLKQSDYPTDCDLISFITPLHWYLEDDVMKTLSYAYEALPSGGTCLIIGYMLNENRDGPIDPAFYHVQAIRDGHFTGHVPSVPEYAAYLDRAGFKDAAYSWLLPNRLGQIEARKP